MTEPITAGEEPAAQPPPASLAFRPRPEPPAPEADGLEPAPPPGLEAPEPEAPVAVSAAPRRRRAGLAVTACLLLATAGLAVALVLTALGLSNDNSLDNARSGALAAARTYAVDLAGYDYRHLAQDFGVVLAHSTPSFRKTFSQSSSALAPTLTKYHATAKAKVVAAGVVSATTSQVVVLVLVDQTVTNSTQRSPTVDRSQLEITLDPSGTGWLINQVTLL